MKQLTAIVSTGIVLVFGTSIVAAGSITVKELRCEYRVNPLGIDVVNPRLSWILESNERGQKQSAYQILVASNKLDLKDNIGDLWDTGKVNSNQSVHIVYAGKELASEMQCFWKVRVWDKDDRPSAWSEQAFWTMGLLNSKDWQAKWIGSHLRFKGNLWGCLPIFRREFDIVKPVSRAYVSICGLGFYELHLNGRKVGGHVLDPGWTNYRKTCLYATYDVTEYITQGRNAFGVMLGNGMYNVTGGRYTKFKGSFGAPKMILQLYLEFADGTITRVVSDNSWRAALGPITFSCIYGGEDYDARQEQPGWDLPGFDDSLWQPAIVVDGPGGRLVSQSAPPIKVMRVFKPVKVTEPEPGVYIYDLGQNFSGWPQLMVRGPAGTKVKMVPGELLDEHGMVTQRSSGGPSFFTYTLKGDGTEMWHPRFTYYGFRYVQAEGATRNPADVSVGKPLLLGIEGHFVHSSAEVVGSFSCSNQMFNRIHEIIDAAILSNLQSVLTDCPHREKLGWLEVSHLMGPAVMFNLNLPLFYTKIINDMSEAQLANGLIPDIAPEYTVFSGGFRDCPGWGSAYVIDPWYVYQTYGDLKVLQKHYEGMKRYVEYLTSQSKGHIVSYGLGDWYDIGPRPPGESQLTPKGLTATALYYYDIRILQKVATLLGKQKDAEEYTALARDVRHAFNERFFNVDTHQYATGSQTSNAMPLALGLVKPDWESNVLENVVKDVRGHGNHLTAGDVGHRFLLLALMKGSRSDVIFDMTSQTDAPGYGYQIKQGATTLTETWGARQDLSWNHCMLGHVEEWFYRGLAGIGSDPGGVGFEKIIIEPQVVDDLEWVKGSYRSIRGEIVSKWKRKGDRLHMEINIPVNTGATVYVPAGDVESIREGHVRAAKAKGVKFLRMEDGKAVFAVGSGEYRFVSNLSQ